MERGWKFSHILSIAMMGAILAFGVFGAFANGSPPLLSATSEQAAGQTAAGHAG